MYEFLDRLISLALPRVRDFRGLNPNAFDGHGNYSLGLTEQLVFPGAQSRQVHCGAGHEHHDLSSRPISDDESRELLRASACRSRREEGGRSKRSKPMAERQHVPS